MPTRKTHSYGSISFILASSHKPSEMSISHQQKCSLSTYLRSVYCTCSDMSAILYKTLSYNIHWIDYKAILQTKTLRHCLYCNLTINYPVLKLRLLLNTTNSNELEY